MITPEELAAMPSVDHVFVRDTVLDTLGLSNYLTGLAKSGGERGGGGGNNGTNNKEKGNAGENDECVDVPSAPPGVNVNDNIASAESAADGALTTDNLVWFYQQVRNGGPWDYKQLGPQYQNFGNFNYGATGGAMGFAQTLLLREAGRAQIAAGTTKPEWGDPGSRLNPWGGTPPYGDDPADQAVIKNGVKYYRSGCGHK